jgi:hypothetical protein
MNWLVSARWAISALSVHLVLAAQLFAQAAPPTDKPEESLQTRYAVVYGLFMLGTILGLMNVVRPGKRKGDKPQPG